MRTWILFAAIVVARAINPDFRFSTNIEATLFSVLLFAGFVVDVVEFLFTLNRKL